MRVTSPSLSDRTRRSTDVLALIAVCGFLFFAGLQILGLVGADEPRYAQIAREMLQRGDWVTPVLYGQPWLEKPPLYYWSAMVAYKATGGVSDWAARLATSVLCTLMIFFIYVWVRHFRRGMQLDAALITAASAILVGFGRSASTDMPLTAMFTAAMLCWYGWYSKQDRGWLLGFYLFAGLGTLAKGPVAVLLAGLIIVIFAALAPRRAIDSAHALADWHTSVSGGDLAVVHSGAARQFRVLPHFLSSAQPGTLQHKSLSPSISPSGFTCRSRCWRWCLGRSL